ncbi:MAG: 1,4-dihydroxy-2-naphthoate octaprenyltransferase [Cytophagales bacterium]
MQSKIKIWLSTFRLRTLPLALASMFVGAAYVYTNFNTSFSWKIFVLSCSTAIFLQILSNIANDYGDAQNGADTADRLGPTRAVSTGLISAKAMFKAIIVFVVLSLVSGIWLLLESFKQIDIQFVLIFLIGLACIAAAIKYTAGKNPYGYRALGDLAVFIFFGLVAVVGHVFLYVHSFHASILFYAIPFGLYSVAVLNVNNIRDISTDIEAGKITLASKLGKINAVKYQLVILILAFIFLTIGLIYFRIHLVGTGIISVVFTLMFIKNLNLYTLEDSEQQTAVLKLTAILTFVQSLVILLFSFFKF